MGQILGCPKCGSMLQILAPEFAGEEPGAAPMAVGDESVDSDAVTQGSSIVAEAGDWEAAVPNERNPLHRFEVDETVSLDTGRLDDPAMVAPDDVPMPPADFESGRTAKRRQFALVTFTLVGGLVISGLLFVMFVRSWRGRSVADSNDPSSVVEADAQSLMGSSTTMANDTALKSDANDSGEADVDADPVDNTLGDSIAAENDESSQSDDPNLNGASELPAELMPADLGEADPDDGVGSMATDDDIGETPTRITELPKDFSDAFAPFVFDMAQASPDAPPVIEGSIATAPLDLTGPAQAALDPMMIANPPPEIDYRSSMALPFRVQAKNGYPFSDFVLLLSQLTSIPIEIDWRSFDLAGVDVAKPVEINTDEKSVQKHLTMAASQLGGTLKRSETILSVTVDDVIFEEAYQQVVATSDFVGGQESARVVLDDFLADESEPQEPDESATDNERQADETDSDVESDEASGVNRSRQQFEMVATESLRRMRGLPGRVDDLMMQRWAVSLDGVSGGAGAGSVNGIWPVVDGGETGAQSLEAMPMAQWVRELARRNQSTCLVHWTDATQRMMSPAQLVLPHTGDGFQSMVSTTLEPFGVQIREVSPGKWWIGTAGRYDQLPVVAWTPVLNDDERRATLTRLNGAIGGLSRDYYRVAHDPVSDRLLVMVPRFILAQMNKFLP